jgi:hypothetical protein
MLKKAGLDPAFLFYITDIQTNIKPYIYYSFAIAKP